MHFHVLFLIISLTVCQCAVNTKNDKTANVDKPQLPSTWMREISTTFKNLCNQSEKTLGLELNYCDVPIIPDDSDPKLVLCSVVNKTVESICTQRKDFLSKLDQLNVTKRDEFCNSVRNKTFDGIFAEGLNNPFFCQFVCKIGKETSLPLCQFVASYYEKIPQITDETINPNTANQEPPLDEGTDSKRVNNDEEPKQADSDPGNNVVPPPSNPDKDPVDIPQKEESLLTDKEKPISDNKEESKKKETVEPQPHDNEPPEISDTEQLKQVQEEYAKQPIDGFEEAPNPHFFVYFLFISGLFIFFYVALYNKKKILALLIEGRRTTVKRRPNSAAYSKLDCNLEEAMTSGPSTSSTNTFLY